MPRNVALMALPNTVTVQILLDENLVGKVDWIGGLRIPGTVDYRGTAPALLNTMLCMFKLDRGVTPAQAQTWLDNHGFSTWKLIGVWDEMSQPTGAVDGEGVPIRKIRSWAVNHGYTLAQIKTHLLLYWPEVDGDGVPIAKIPQLHHWQGMDTWKDPENDPGFLSDYNQEPQP